MPDSKHLIIHEPTLSTSGKTNIWRVHSKHDGSFLGEVRWFARWCKYSFFPWNGCIFEQECLRYLAEFLEEETKRKRNG